jgi:hypothetical protein
LHTYRKSIWINNKLAIACNTFSEKNYLLHAFYSYICHILRVNVLVFQKLCATEAAAAPAAPAVDVEVKPLTIKDLAGFMKLTVKHCMYAPVLHTYADILSH